MDVIERLVELRAREHESTVLIVAGLLECARTKAHVDLGHATLWAFPIGHLNYSKAAAWRRLRAMKCARKFPVVLEYLRDHRVSLSALSQMASLLDDFDRAEEFLARIEGRSEREVELFVARARPAAAPVERVKAVYVKPKAPRPPAPMLAESARPEGPRRGPAHTKPTTEPDPRVVLKFSISPEQYAAFERARWILSRKFGREPSLEECFAEFVGMFLEKKAPKVRTQREGSAPGPVCPASPTPAAESAPDSSRSSAPNHSRHVPRRVRDAVFLRDGERCTYVGPGGHHCEATTNLHLDHIEPFALGGAHEEKNLRVLCAAHNRRRAEIEFGMRELRSEPSKPLRGESPS